MYLHPTHQAIVYLLSSHMADTPFLVDRMYMRPCCTWAAPCRLVMPMAVPVLAKASGPAGAARTRAAGCGVLSALDRVRGRRHGSARQRTAHGAHQGTAGGISAMTVR